MLIASSRAVCASSARTLLSHFRAVLFAPRAQRRWDRTRATSVQMQPCLEAVFLQNLTEYGVLYDCGDTK